MNKRYVNFGCFQVILKLNEIVLFDKDITNKAGYYNENWGKMVTGKKKIPGKKGYGENLSPSHIENFFEN